MIIKKEVKDFLLKIIDIDYDCYDNRSSLRHTIGSIQAEAKRLLETQLLSLSSNLDAVEIMPLSDEFVADVMADKE